MAGRRGRSNAAMLARMGRILLLLRAHPSGLTTDQLLERVGYGDASRESRMRTLHRDLAALAADGWRIDTGQTANTPAVRVLRTVDNRFATLFTPAQRAELARAAACAGPEIADALADDLGRASGTPPFVTTPRDGRGRLATCQAAAADRCQLRFTYKGRTRLVDPLRVVLRPGGWYLSARDSGDALVKYFAIDRIEGLLPSPPGSSTVVVDHPTEPVWDFMGVPVHEPYTATLDTSEAHLLDVLGALAVNGHDLLDPPDPATVRVEVVVTNTEALVDRLLELGTRARLVGPDRARDALRARLLQAVGR